MNNTGICAAILVQNSINVDCAEYGEAEIIFIRSNLILIAAFVMTKKCLKESNQMIIRNVSHETRSDGECANKEALSTLSIAPIIGTHDAEEIGLFGARIQRDPLETLFFHSCDGEVVSAEAITPMTPHLWMSFVVSHEELLLGDDIE